MLNDKTMVTYIEKREVLCPIPVWIKVQPVCKQQMTVRKMHLPPHLQPKTLTAHNDDVNPSARLYAMKTNSTPPLLFNKNPIEFEAFLHNSEAE